MTYRPSQKEASRCLRRPNDNIPQMGICFVLFPSRWQILLVAVYFTGKQWTIRRRRHPPDVSAASQPLDLHLLLDQMIYWCYLALDMLLISFDFSLRVNHGVSQGSKLGPLHIQPASFIRLYGCKTNQSLRCPNKTKLDDAYETYNN